MKANKYISKREHKLILLVAFASFIFSIAGSITYNIKADFARLEYYREQEENKAQNKPVFAGPYCFPDQHPEFLFSIILLVGLIFSSLCVTKRYLLSSIFTIASIAMFIFWFIDTRKELVYDELGIVKGVDRIFYKAGDFDLAVFFLVSILLFWQISILLRMLIKVLRKESVLP
ncbi:MAG TPA: hypothetical protein VF556_12555 [Pyrinomonadaceae bacterium]|jgi:hypothetical protein